MNKKWIKFTTIAVLAVFLFLCKGGSLNSVAHNMVMGHSGDMNSMPCCDVENATSIQHDVGEAILSQKEVVISSTTSFVLALLSSFAILVVRHQLRYALLRERRFGSFALLNYFTLLFRRGILHPKSW